MIANTPLPMDLAEFFPILGDHDQTPIDPARRRSFVGDGTPFMEVPGLQSIELITIDGVKLDEYRDDEVVDPDNPTKTKTMRIPMYVFGQHNGVPTLLRSLISNFGIWQKGSTVNIVGDWEEAAPAAAPSAESPKAEA